MSVPSTCSEFLYLLRKSGLIEDKQLDEYLDRTRVTDALPPTPAELARALVRDGLLSDFQADRILAGRVSVPSTCDEFLYLLRKSGLIEDKRLDEYLDGSCPTDALSSTPAELARALVRDGLLSDFQADRILAGRVSGPSTCGEFVDLIRKSGLIEDNRLDEYLHKAAVAEHLPSTPAELARALVRDGLLSDFQADRILAGAVIGFVLGGYKVLGEIARGPMAGMYLCEDTVAHRLVTVKILPVALARDPVFLKRFAREARALRVVKHRNIVRVYSVGRHGNLHFIVMEYVDGTNLRQIVQRTGPMDPVRVAHYIRQAALALQHASETFALVHRDIEPRNIMVDRSGTVKIVDMGLARIVHYAEDVLSGNCDDRFLGTADYLAPEQALNNSGNVRADIYSLGGTFYYCLTGQPPFGDDGSITQKLLWHQSRNPQSIRSLRPEIPEEMAGIVERMLAKDPGHRFPSHRSVADALTPWTQRPIPPPPRDEMPKLCPAVLAVTARRHSSPRIS